MTDGVDSKRRSAMKARFRGRDTVPEVAVRRVAHRMGIRSPLYGNGPLDTSVVPFPLACNRLLNPDTSDDGPNSGRLRSRGANLSGTAVRRPRLADDGGSGGASVGRSCGGVRYRPNVRGIQIYRKSRRAGIQTRHTAALQGPMNRCSRLLGTRPTI